VKEPNWVEEHVALAVHARLLALYGGASGQRDKGLLQSALARPRQLFAYVDPPSMIELAATYTAGILRNHPFIDGNNRTGLVIAVLFLETNGYRFTASEEDATQAVLNLAAGVLDENGFTTWLGACAKRVIRYVKKPSR